MKYPSSQLAWQSQNVSKSGDNKIKCSCIHHSWWMHFSIEHLCYTPPIEYWMNSYTCILSRIFQWLPSRDGVAPGGTNVLRRPDTFSQAMHWKTSQEGSTSYIYKWWKGMSWIFIFRLGFFDRKYMQIMIAQLKYWLAIWLLGTSCVNFVALSSFNSFMLWLKKCTSNTRTNFLSSKDLFHLKISTIPTKLWVFDGFCNFGSRWFSLRLAATEI